MKLSELAAYAKEKYHMEEQHKWSDFPSFSVLCHPETGKWVALLMRQWDPETGSQLERCDIKCGSQILSEVRKPYLSPPLRMHGSNWVGIAFEEKTEPEAVFLLLDRAVALGNRGGFMIVLDEKSGADNHAYSDTALPFAGVITRGFPSDYTVKKKISPGQGVPEKLREMIGLYEYGDGSLSHKARIFYRQGKFMEDYEDEVSWNGEYQRYYTTYHDLNIRQLRGYFTWRTNVRKGEYSPIATSLAYLYVYELLCGIGSDSPEDTLRKIKDFEKGYLDSGIGDQRMRRNLSRWCLEYAILHGLPREIVLSYIDPAVPERDHALAVLKNPEKYTDDEIFSALSAFAGKKLIESPVLKSDEGKGKHLFSELWRYLSEHYRADGKSIFTACFGRQNTYKWYPLSNAVYFEEYKAEDTDFILDECRSYHLRDGIWKEKRYDPLYFDKDKLRAVIHESDRLFRRYLKTGYYTKEKPEEAWVSPYVQEVLKAEHKAEIDAAKPRIEIDFSGLERIRLDAIITRNSLLTEEETEDDWESTAGEEEYTAPEGRDTNETSFSESSVEGLDALYFQILTDVISGQSAEQRILKERLMPSVVTDTINEAFFDEIGDNILECNGDRITLVEDYREDVMEILGGQSK